MRRHHKYTLTVKVSVFADEPPTKDDLKAAQVDIPCNYTTLEYEVVRIKEDKR